MFTNNHYYTESEVAEALPIAVGTLRNWRYLRKTKGKDAGPAYCKFGGKVVYLGEHLNAFVRRNMIGAGGQIVSKGAA